MMQTTATRQDSKQATDTDVPREHHSCVNNIRIYSPPLLRRSSGNHFCGLARYSRFLHKR